MTTALPTILAGAALIALLAGYPDVTGYLVLACGASCIPAGLSALRSEGRAKSALDGMRSEQRRKAD